MRHTRRVTSAVFGLLLATSFIAAANDTSDDLSAIRAQQTELRAAAQAGEGIFKGVSEAERTAVAAQQTELLAMLEGKQTARDLDDATRLAAHDLLQRINAAVDDAESQQVVCRSVKETGSSRRTKQCTPVADRSLERAAVQRALDRAAIGG